MENIKNRKFALHNGLGLPGGLTPDNFEAQWHANHQVQLNISNCSDWLPAGPLFDANAVPAVWKFLSIRLIWNSCRDEICKRAQTGTNITTLNSMSFHAPIVYRCLSAKEFQWLLNKMKSSTSH
jgi:hypothetical protein